MVGYMVRGKLEDALRGVADRVPAISVAEERAPGSKWRRTELRSGPVVLIENAVETPCGSLRRAEFRRTLAKRNQGSLFPDDTRRDSDPLYVALIHTRSLWDANDRQKWGHLPGSAYLGFPARDLDSYVYDLNLFEMFPDVVTVATPNEWSSEALVRYIRRARKPYAA
jgi:hypothetical protein